MPHWTGGECPVDSDMTVRFMIRASADRSSRYSPYPTAPAGKLRWSHDGGPGDLVFYKTEGS